MYYPFMAQCLNGELKVGQKVAYPTRQGSSLDMTIAEVVDIKTKKHRWRAGEYTFVVVKRIKTTGYYQPRKDAKLVPVHCLDRVVIVNEPELILQLVGQEMHG